MEQKTTTTIQRTEHGKIERVRSVIRDDDQRMGVAWKKRERGGIMTYLASEGWSEVSSKLDITEKIEIRVYRQNAILLSPTTSDSGSYSATFAQAVVLPEGMTWEDLWKHITQGSPKVYWDYLKDAATTVIQVWQKS